MPEHDTSGGRIHGFPPLARPDARILILGSMPSRESLARRRYYAHPRNAFWPIMADLPEIGPVDYGEGVRLLMARGIAVWDVLRDCVRPGSLDADIDDKTAATNDFNAFFETYPAIRGVFFNGAKAESVYLRRVLPGLAPAPAGLPRRRLPSTSPANAGTSYEHKRETWRIALAEALE